MVPALSVTYLPLAVPITLPSESVTKNSTSEIGALVTASFDDQQRAHLIVAEGHGNDILILTGEIDRFRGVGDHIAVRSRNLFADISACGLRPVTTMVPLLEVRYSPITVPPVPEVPPR